MNHNEQWRRSQGDSSAFSRLTLRLVLGAFAVAGLPTQLPGVDTYDDDAYPVRQVRAFAAGKWHVAREIPGGTSPQFVVDFEPGWPVRLSLEVTWGSEIVPADSSKTCRELSSAVSQIKVEVYVSSGWQTLPGHPTYVPMGWGMRYTVPNVDRRNPISIRASCEYEADGVKHFSGSAKIRFEPKDPLFGWNPGLPKDTTAFSIVDPDEGESMSSTKPFMAQVKCSPCVNGWKGQITMEIEKATKYQTGTVATLPFLRASLT